jgi:SAM-dependent methyltransferase
MGSRHRCERELPVFVTAGHNHAKNGVASLASDPAISLHQAAAITVIARSQRVRPEVAGPMTSSATKQSRIQLDQTGLLRFARNDAIENKAQMVETSDPRLYHAHVARNREPILAVLKRLLPARALVLEVASGSGEHAAFFAKSLPSVSWLPSDVDTKALGSIAAFRAEAGVPNLLAPVRLDVTSDSWPVKRLNAVVCNNLTHISPWAASQGLMAGAGRTLRAGGVLYLYGPFKIDGRHTARSNLEFDAYLRGQNAEWGIRDLGEMRELAARHGLTLAETVPMPANNLSVIFQREG